MTATTPMLTFKQLKAQALNLPEADRLELANDLLDTLPESECDCVDPDEVKQAWIAEVNRRANDVRTGKVAMIPGDVFLQQLKDKFG